MAYSDNVEWTGAVGIQIIAKEKTMPGSGLVENTAKIIGALARCLVNVLTLTAWKATYLAVRTEIRHVLIAS